MCLYAFQFIICKVSLDAFSLLYSKLLLEATLFLASVCLLLSVFGREGSVWDCNSRGRRFQANA